MLVERICIIAFGVLIIAFSIISHCYDPNRTKNEPENTLYEGLAKDIHEHLVRNDACFIERGHNGFPIIKALPGQTIRGIKRYIDKTP